MLQSWSVSLLTNYLINGDNYTDRQLDKTDRYTDRYEK